MKKIAILGSTGSIGTQTLDVIRKTKDIQVLALTAGHNIELLEQQIREFKPEFAAVCEEQDAVSLKCRLKDIQIKIGYGMEGLIEAATMDKSQILVTAIVGMMGLEPTVAAIKAGKDIALANKETLVTAGHLIMPLAKKMGVKILPVDSEHSAIFQCLRGGEGCEVRRLLLTASGGPFRGWSRNQMERVTPGDALKHPNWSMGRKISIDSATMVNKGLEVMEAGWLFAMPRNQIQVVVHPQSVIHSMVEYSDGAVIAQLGTADMRLPIQYALCYPERGKMVGSQLDIFQVGKLTFEEPDYETFYGLKLADLAMSQGGNMPTIFNEANERAVDLFLHEKISFLGIPELIQTCMEQVKYCKADTINDILETKQVVDEYIESRW